MTDTELLKAELEGIATQSVENPPKSLTATRRPYWCADCRARGALPQDYHPDGSSDTANVDCESCRNTGVVWR